MKQIGVTRTIRWAGAAVLLVILLSWAVQGCLPQPVPADPATPLGTIVVESVPTAASLRETVVVEPGPTETPAEAVAALAPTAQGLEIDPVALGANIRIDSWSPTGDWLAYWLSTPEDLSAETFAAPPGSLYFTNPDTGQICSHPEFRSDQYTQQVSWQPDGHAVVRLPGQAWIGGPCAGFNPAPDAVVQQPDLLDPALSPDGVFRAETNIHQSSNGILELVTSVEQVDTGQIVTTVEWAIEERLGELGLGGEWLARDLFLIYETLDQGPLLVTPGAEVIQIAPELFNVPAEVISPPGERVFLRAYGQALDGTDTYHLLLSGVGSEAYFPPVRLYHSDSGLVEELPFKYLWQRGFALDGRWLLFDSRPISAGYESYALWTRPADPPGSETSLFAEGTPYTSWSPDQEKVAFSWPGRITIFSFPAGEQVSAWDTQEYSTFPLVWSPNGDFLAGVGNIMGEQEYALFVIPVQGS